MSKGHKESTMISIKCLLVAGLMAALMAMPIGPAGHIGAAHASQLSAAETSEMSNGGPRTTIVAQAKKTDLVADGYTCTRIATGFTECTKKSATTYWCDNSGSCQPKPRTNEPQTPRSPMVFDRDGVLSTVH